LRSNSLKDSVTFLLETKYSSEKAGIDSSEPVCDKPWNNALIDLNGNVQFCCWIHERIGSLNDSEFYQIWNGEKARKIRSVLLRKEIPSCCTLCPVYLDHRQIYNSSNK